MQFVIRAVVFESRELGVFRAEGVPGLHRFLGGGSCYARVTLKVLSISRVGLLVQKLPGNSVEVVWEPIIRIEAIGSRLCRYHEGPRGIPEKHWYCDRHAVTSDGYCRLHSSSWKALYEKCAQGLESACIRVAPLLSGEKFSVYVLDYGGGRVKVGLTQEWRLLWRIAEQPHIAAARVFTGGLLEARELERRLGRSRIATEGAAVKISERFRVAAAEVSRAFRAGRFQTFASRLASSLSSLGLCGDYEAYTVLPRSTAWLLSASELHQEDIIGKELRVVDYWAGRLYVSLGTTAGYMLPRQYVQHLSLQGSLGPG